MGRVMILIPRTVEGYCNTCYLEYKYIFMNIFKTPAEEGWLLKSSLVYIIPSLLLHAKPFPSLYPTPIIMSFFHSYFIEFNIYLFVYIDFYKMHVYLSMSMFNVHKWCWHITVFFYFSTKHSLLKTHSFCCEMDWV